MKYGPDCIILDHVSFAYPSSEGAEFIIKDINLTIRRGEWLAIAGTNGSGKSTLAKLIAKLFPVSSGEVRVMIPETPPIQLIFQNPDIQVIGETVYEDLCFGMENYGVTEPEINRRAYEALEKVGLSALSDMPVSQLSGGQKQLLAVASCLCVKPAVLVFDEATSMLDPLSRQNILRTAKKLHREGTTVVWITQWLDELAWADRVIALEQGRIAFEGTPSDFFYRKDGNNKSFCDRLGFPPPYTVQVALTLMDKGFKLDPLPLTPAELGKSVRANL